jgi:Mg-chelatase subunit ChlI
VVDIEGVREVDERIGISDRRAAFEADPKAFANSYAADQRALTEEIMAAQDRLEGIGILDWIGRAMLR